MERIDPVDRIGPGRENLSAGLSLTGNREVERGSGPPKQEETPALAPQETVQLSEKARAELEATQTPQGPQEPAPEAPAQNPQKLTPLEGYDSNKLNDPNHKTPKYIFGRVAQKYSLESVKDKAGAEQLLQRMLPELQAAGLEVAQIKGDKILVKTKNGYEWVDVVRGANSGNPGWWWGAEGGGAGAGAPLEGFDPNKLNDPNHRTSKYLFGRVAQGYSLDGVADKASAEQLLRRMLRDLEAAGLEIVDVKGDKILVRTQRGYEWVDVVRGAGSGSPAWWWGPLQP